MADASLYITDFNHVHCKLRGDKSTLYEIQDHFTFFAENYKHTPKFKAGVWDGKIRALNLKTGCIYKGLIPAVIKYCEDNNISYEIDPKIANDKKFDMTDEDVVSLYQKIGGIFEPKDYQIEAVKYSINNKRAILLSPTGSGKSYYLYGLSRFFNKIGLRVLIVVHRAHLVKQIVEKNFAEEYDQQRDSFTYHTIYSGKDKNTTADITASTWQSIVDMPESYFSQFDVILADEVHAWKAASTIKLMEKTKDIEWKIGTTGTLDDIAVSLMTLEGLFGPVHRLKRTHELISRGDLAQLKIKTIVLNYNKEDSALVSKMNYIQEVKFIEEHQSRKNFVKKIAASFPEGNTLIVFRHEEHGRDIYESIETDKKFYIDGSVSIEQRDKYCEFMENNTGVVGVVSIGTFAEGINIRNLNTVVMVCVTKAKIKLLQLIGRVLRISDVFGSKATFIEICDNLKYKKKTNFALLHGLERYKRYQEEQFDVEFMEYNL